MFRHQLKQAGRVLSVALTCMFGVIAVFSLWFLIMNNTGSHHHKYLVPRWMVGVSFGSLILTIIFGLVLAEFVYPPKKAEPAQK